MFTHNALMYSYTPPQIFWKMKDRCVYAWGHKNVPKVLSPLEDIGVTKELLDLELVSATFTL